MGKTCPVCHRENDSAAKFCKYCGTALSAQNGSNGLTCPNCKTVNRSGSRFCKHCGSALEQKPAKDPFAELKTEFDSTVRASIESLRGSIHLPFTSFMSEAVSLSEDILSTAERHKEASLSSPQSSFTAQFIDYLDRGVGQCREEFWKVCDQRLAQEALPDKNNPIFNRRYEVLPKEEWPSVTRTDGHLSSRVFIGDAECSFNVLGKSFPYNSHICLDLLYKKNLVVHFNTETEQSGIDMVSSIVGRWLKASQGRNIEISVIDTQDFWGLGSGFNSLDESVHCLISDEHSALRELERVSSYEQNIIRNRLSRQTPTALGYNLSHVDQIPAVVLIIRHFPLDVSSNLEVLQRIMRNSARVGVCVILMVNEDELTSESLYKTKKDFDLDNWRKGAEYIDLIDNYLQFLPKGARFVPELLDETELNWIIDEVNVQLYQKPSVISVDIRDFLPDPGRTLNTQFNLSLAIGVNRDTFSQQTLVLNDMVISNSLLVLGTGDSAGSIRNWMKAIALYAIRRYSPDSLSILFCDFSNSGVFSSFAGKLDNIRVVQKPKAKMITAEEPRGRTLVFVAGINALDEKELSVLESLPRMVNRGTHVFMEDLGGYIKNWGGQRLTFGPAEKRSGGFVSEQEFLYDSHLCRCFKTDNATVDETIDALLRLHPELAPKQVVANRGLYEEAAESLTTDTSWDPANTGNVESFVEAGISVEETESYQEGPLYLSRFLPPRNKWWTYSSAEGLEIPIGINPWKEDTVTNLIFSQAEGQSDAFVIGKSGTGKSSLLHTIILNAAYKYSPSELNLYLIDLSGVEFQYYATYNLPHAKLVAPQAEREFALSILDEVEQEAKRREEQFSRAGIRDFSSARDLPRILLIIDEYQSLFDFDDEICTDSKEIIERIITKYRKYGINLLLATQKLPGTNKLDYGMINNRIVFDCKQDDFTTLFGPLNRQPALGKGECLYTSRGRLLADVREHEVKSYYAAIDEVSDDGKLMAEHLIGDLSNITPGVTYAPARVFVKDREVFFGPERLHNVAGQEEFPEEVNLYLGEPVATGQDVTITLEGSAQDNILIVGGQREVAEGIAIHAILSAADAYVDGSATCYVMSFMKKRATLYSSASTFLCGAPFSEASREVPREEFVSFIKELKGKVEERQRDFSGESPHIYLLFLEYQNSGIDSDVKKSMEFILKNGPQFGVFTVLQSGALGSLKERGADKDLFNHRIALQMSKEDSRDMMGSNKAAFLNGPKDKSPGLQRAFYFNKSSPGTHVKFRPYSYSGLIIDNAGSLL